MRHLIGTYQNGGRFQCGTYDDEDDSYAEHTITYLREQHPHVAFTMTEEALVAATEPAQRILDLHAEADWMGETLSGCDWCCGGGDRRMKDICEELRQLGAIP